MDQRGTRASNTTGQAPAVRLAAVLLAGGTLHLAAPQFFDAIIPARLPGRARTYTRVSGTSALIIGTGLSFPRTRRTSAALACAFFIAFMPAKFQLAANWRHRGPLAAVLGVVQLFWQVPLVTEAIRAHRDAPRRC